MNYVIKNGIEATRLTAKGFGESQPIDTNETTEGRKNNRRTEFLVK
jgi:outer membrane protein OmpA-like peptidoglycan-associated protein